MDDLLAALREAPHGQEGRILEELVTEWSKSGSPTIDLLLQRGRDALSAGEPERAVEHFTAAIDWDPDFAEAYHARAEAFYYLGHVGPALADLQVALSINPDQFIAMRGFAVILEELDRPEEALEVYRVVLEYYPGDAESEQSIDRLEQMLGGQSL
ncbi:tetratricopeptide repeat protein [Pseudoroseicyclus tamaricis]|uniref:Tetratricopeptide repeat protein n=1 Tax=Pseudoroseicyclus tamaricis TaxID=2705421 RepID=A0A6B2K0F2_9RHOB|nr:tetratricopeptide repeat protein [Pseudoroseicyclus tamaricis]NDV01924.1 tetratricopeptide repeat protein [Pseudoroseicyclus tamaricis]